jgi:hypothetical protein
MFPADWRQGHPPLKPYFRSTAIAVIGRVAVTI